MSDRHRTTPALVRTPSIRPGPHLAWTLLFVGGLVMVTPLAFMFSTSLKTAGQVYDLQAHPGGADARQLHRGARRTGASCAGSSIRCSIAVIVTLSNVFFDSLVGYTLAKFEFRGRYFVFLAILSTLMIPTEMLVIPWYLMAQQVRLARQLLGHHVPRHDDGLRHLPDEAVLRDRARTTSSKRRAIDGLNEFQIWWRWRCRW